MPSSVDWGREIVPGSCIMHSRLSLWVLINDKVPMITPYGPNNLTGFTKPKYLWLWLWIYSALGLSLNRMNKNLIAFLLENIIYLQFSADIYFIFCPKFFLLSNANTFNMLLNQCGTPLEQECSTNPDVRNFLSMQMMSLHVKYILPWCVPALNLHTVYCCHFIRNGKGFEVILV